MAENVLPFAGRAQTQEWREAHLYNEDVDTVFRSYRSLLYIVFAAFAKETLAGSEAEGFRTVSTMGLPDFKRMCERSGLVRVGARGGASALASRDVTHRDVRFAFVWSLQPVEISRSIFTHWGSEWGAQTRTDPQLLRSEPSAFAL